MFEMRKLLFFAMLSMVMGFSSCKKEVSDPACEAGNAAKEYYDMLIAGKVDAFVAGCNKPERIPDSYQEQLLLNARMFVEQQTTEHRGLSAVRVCSAKADTARHVAEVFLQICYADSTKEQILVPMVRVGDTWKMR